MGSARNHFTRQYYTLLLPCLSFILFHEWAHGEWISVTPPDVSENWNLYAVRFSSANESWPWEDITMTMGGAGV